MAKNQPHIALFIPCYVDQFYPKVGIATLELLEKFGCKVSYPMDQTCCGQPMTNAGFERKTLGTTNNFLNSFTGYDYIVAPTGSCVLHVKEHSPTIPGREKDQIELSSKIFELSEFLHDVLEVEPPSGDFNHKVGFHSSCHGQRGLRLSSSSELQKDPFNKAKALFENIAGIEWAKLNRQDECCGFGGTFAVKEEALSIQMGKDRLNDHAESEVEIITGGDMSCLMHLQGIASRQKAPVRFMHFAEILNQVMK